MSFLLLALLVRTLRTITVSAPAEAHSIVSRKLAGNVLTSRITYMTFPEEAGVSTIVRKTKPGPPESESRRVHFAAAKSDALPAHNARFVPGVMSSNDISNTAAVVVVTGEPLTRYLLAASTVPVM